MDLVQNETYDMGLRRYMSSVYNWMMLGLLISALTAWATVSTGLVATLASGGILFWLVLLAPFALILIMGGGMNSMSTNTMRMLYVVFTVLEGMSLSVVLTHYTGSSIIQAFVSTAAAFAGLSLWGYTTKKDLSGVGNFLFMALIGLIVAMLLSVFFPSPGFTLLISIAGVLIFSALVAYDTQTLKEAYCPGDDEMMAKIAIWGALDLYLDFLNLFLFLLRIFGVSSSSDD